MHLKKFGDLIFVADKLSEKVAKIMSLENFYVYSISRRIRYQLVDNFHLKSLI